MDKYILFVNSDILTTRATANKNLISFHKRNDLCLNGTVLERLDVRCGMFGKFESVDNANRIIKLIISEEKPLFDKRKWYKLRNPQVSEYNRYCYLKTTHLTYDFNMILLGAFNYMCSEENGYKTIYIKF